MKPISTELRLEAYELTFGVLTLQELEWSGVQYGPGSGPMDSGDDGTPYAACPCCGQLKEPNGEFIPEAVGHTAECEMKLFMERIS